MGHEGLVERFIGSHKGVECRFYFDPAGGDLLAIEMFADEQSDPCEIYFADYREIDGRWLPGRMEVRYGNDPFATFRLNGFKFERRGGLKSGIRICKVQCLFLFSVLASSASAKCTTLSTAPEQRIVKIYGAGGFRGMVSYQSGMLVSPQGHVLTAYSYVLDTDYIKAGAGRRPAVRSKTHRRDPRLEVAVLKIDAVGLPWFDLRGPVRADAGTQCSP